MRAAQLVIDLQAIRHNFEFLSSESGAAQVMPVIKANAYGHGAVDVARCLEQADAFAVAYVNEAVELRQAGIDKPILVLQGARSRAEYKTAEHQRLWLVVHSEAQASEAVYAAVDVPLWLKVDTGMSRLGIPLPRVEKILQRLGSRCVSLMSHFASADRPADPENDIQLERFQELVSRFQLEASMANSAAMLGIPSSRLDWVRPGIALYGGNPFLNSDEKPKTLRSVMSLEAPLVSVNLRRKGSRIGYAGISELTEDSLVGVVSVGYADGYPRAVRPGTPVWVNGRFCPTLGRVSMDMVCVDLRNAEDARPGDRVQLWGSDVSVDVVAESAGSIAYELLCQAGTALLGRGGRD